MVRSTSWPFCPRGKNLLSSSCFTWYKQSINTNKDTWARNPSVSNAAAGVLESCVLCTKSPVSSQQHTPSTNTALVYSTVNVIIEPELRKGPLTWSLCCSCKHRTTVPVITSCVTQRHTLQRNDPHYSNDSAFGFAPLNLTYAFV